MKVELQMTGKDSLRNSQLAFSMVSKVLWLILRQGGVSEPAGIRVTSIFVSAYSSVFSKIGWSLVYQKVTGRFILLSNMNYSLISSNENLVCFIKVCQGGVLLGFAVWTIHKMGVIHLWKNNKSNFDWWMYFKANVSWIMRAISKAIARKGIVFNLQNLRFKTI